MLKLLVFKGPGYTKMRKEHEKKLREWSSNVPDKRVIFGQAKFNRSRFSLASEKNALFAAIVCAFVIYLPIFPSIGKGFTTPFKLERERKKFRKELDEQEKLIDSTRLVSIPELTKPPDFRR